MKSMKRRNNNHRITHIYLILVLVGLFILFSWSQLVNAMPLTAQHHLERAWRYAGDIGRFEYHTDVTQTTHPTARLENAGRHPSTQRMTTQGMVDRPNKAMQMRLWSPDAGRDGIELKVENSQAFGRLNSEAEWQEIPNPTNIFAPGGDPLGFLVATENVQELGIRSQGLEGREVSPNSQSLTPNSYKRYAFDINSARYAEYVRQQLEGAMRERGELPPQIRLGVIKQYVNMAGRGEIWLDETGLPVRQIIHLEFPPEPGAYNWTEANITTSFSGWEQGLEARGSMLLPLARRLWENPDQLLTDPQALIPNPQPLIPALGLTLLLVALALMAITHRKSPKFYGAVTLAMIAAMLVTPLLQSNQAQAFSARQRAKQTQFEQQRETYQAIRDARTKLSSSTYNPTVNPLAINNSPSTSYNSSDSLPLTSYSLLPNASSCDLTDLEADCDGDELSNGVEMNKLGTDPTKADTDGDYISDKTEVAGFTYNSNTWYLDPLNPDSNGDQGPDGAECPELIDIDTDTGEINPDVTPGTCANTDSDSVPDVFDYDDDDDGVPDNVDSSPLDKSGVFDSVGNDLAFNLKLNGNGKPIFVDFQIRPTNEDHLYQTGNVLDWPTNDTDGQVRRVFDTTFAETAGYEDTYRGDRGDMVLNPMLEFEITFDAANPSAGLPITPTMTSADITGYDDLSWLDTDALEQVGISVNEGDNNTLLLWAPLTYVEDELAGDTRVAWQARMMYQPETSQTTLGNNQSVRLVWMIEALTDTCYPPDGEDYDDYCANKSNWETGSSVIQTYYEEFTLTGLTVREDHGLNLAVIAEPPGTGNANYDDQLWHLANSLQEGLLRGELKSTDNLFTVADIATYASTWGVGDLDITNYSYETQLGLAEIAGGESTDILNRVFSGAGVGDSATLLFAGEETARLVTLGDSDSQWSGNTLRPDLTADTAYLNTSTTLRWAPYVYEGADVWDSLNLETYFDELETDLSAVFTDSELDNLTPSESISDYDTARQGAIFLAQNYYLSLFIGLNGLVKVDGELVNSDILADYSLGSSEPVTTIVKAMLADIQDYYGEISIVQNLTDSADNIDAAAALSATFAGSLSAILTAAGDIAGGNADNTLSLTFQKLGDYYKTTSVDSTTFTNISSFSSLAAASTVSGLSQGWGIAYGLGKAAYSGGYWLYYGLKVVSAAQTGTVLVSQGASLVTKLSYSGSFWAVVSFVTTTSMAWTLFALGNYENALQRSTALAQAIATTIVAIIMAVIIVIPVVGFLISGIIGLIDGLAALVCAAVGVEAGSTVDVWVCGGLTGALTTAITYLIFDQYILVDLDKNDRVDIALETPELIQQTDNAGPVVGNDLSVRATITTTISLDSASGIYAESISTLEDLLGGQSLNQRMKKATFAYTLQDSKTDHHSGLAQNQLDWNNNTEVFEVSLQKPLTAAGINQTTPAEYLTESFNVPYIECWTFFCKEKQYKDSLHNYLGEEFVLDIFPATFAEFISLTSEGDDSYRLSWDSQFPTLVDADGDGLRSKASGGPDPDDATWDADSDGLTDLWERANGFNAAAADGDNDGLYDYWEAFYGTNPRLADSDGDGLDDGAEFFHSRSRHPYQQDTQSWSGGWDLAYTDTSGQTGTTWVNANPLDYDSDDDTISDQLEQIYGYNPNIPSVLNVLTLNSAIDDGIVQPGVTINYTATIKNELDGRTLNGLLQAELPVDTVLSTEVMDEISPLESITMTSAVNAPSVTQSTVTSLTIRAGVVVSSNLQTGDPPGPVFYLDEFDSSFNPASDYTGTDDSGYNQTVTCNSSSATFNCVGDESAIVNNGFNFSEFDRLEVSGQDTLKLGSNDNTFSMMMWLNPQNNFDFVDDDYYYNFGVPILGQNYYDSPEDDFPSIRLIGGGTAGYTVESKVQMHFGHADGLGYCLATSDDILTHDEWQHLAVTFDGAQFYFYINGALVDTQTGQNCAGQDLYAAKDFIIGHNDGLAAYIKEVLPTAGSLQEGYIWSDDNTTYNNQTNVIESGGYYGKSDNPNLIWFYRLDAMHKNPSGYEQLVYYPATWIVSGKSSLTFWTCNMDDESVGAPLGCLSSDNNDDEPMYYSKDGSQTFEVTHDSSETSTNNVVQSYSKDYNNNKWGADITYNLTNNAFYGQLDEIALYNTALSGANVEDLYLSSLRVANLTFDEPPGQTTFADATAFNTAATCSGDSCPDSGIPGRDNQALRFDGVDDYVEFPQPLGPSAQTFSASAWFKLDTLTSGNQMILQQKDGSGTGRSWLYVTSSGQLGSYLGGSALSSAAGLITPGRWYHAALATDGSSLELFLDGQSVAQTSITVEAADGDLLIGTHKSLTQNFFGGMIDEVVVQRGALTTDTLQELILEAPILNLHLDEDLNAGSFVDDTPMANHATCSGSACPQAGTKGQMREAAIFDGNNDVLLTNISNISDTFNINLDDLENNFTVSMWVRPDQAESASDRKLIDMERLSLYMPANSTQLEANIWVSGLSSNYNCYYPVSINSGNTTLTLNQWNHIAFTIDKNSANSDGQYPLTLYINGVQAAQKYQSYGGNVCNQDATPSFGENMSGALDEIAIFGDALRDTEIQDLYDYQAAWFDQTYAHTIIIDTDNPEVSLGLAAGHLPLAETLLDIEAVDISSDIASVQVTVTEPGGGVSTVNAVPSDDSTSKAWFYTFNPAAEGQYTLDLLATDEAGNTGSSSSSFYVDDTPPAGTLDSSLTAAIMQTTPPAGDGPNTVTLFGTIGDSGPTSPAGVDSNTLTVEVLDWQNIPVEGSQFAAYTASPEGWQVDYPFAQPAYGQYNVRLSAADSVGNVYSATLGSIALDDLAPTADIILPGSLLTDTTTTLIGTATTIPYPSQSKRLYLHFEENSGATQFVDAARNHAVAGCSTCPTAGQSGQYGNAAQFDSSDLLTVTTEINPISDTFTAMAWFNSAALDGTLLAQNGGDDWLALNSGNLSSSLGGSTTNGPSTVSTGSWHHAAVTFDGELVRLYLDGTLEISATRSAAYSDGDLVIGADDGFGAFFKGNLDELVVYDTVLSADQLYDIANPLATGITSAQIRFRHQQDADQGENDGDWADVTLASAGANFTTWSVTPPSDLEGPYQIDLKVTNDLGNSTFIPNIWNGSIDLLAPRLTLDYSLINSQYARATCYAYDYNITSTNWLCPAEGLTSIAESADWYTQAFSTTARTTAYSTTLQTVSALSDTMTACDIYNHCATTTITNPLTLDEAIAILTPTNTEVITGLIPIEVSGYAHSIYQVKTIELLVNGESGFNSGEYTGSITETTWATTWQPDQPGAYTLQAVMTTWNGSTAVTDPVEVTVQINAPKLNISKTSVSTGLSVGDTLTYTIVVSNSGNLDAGGVRITDTLAASLSGADLDETVTLPAGSAVTYTIPAQVAGSILYVENTAWVSHTWERASASTYDFLCDRFEVFTDADSGYGSLRHAIDNACGASLITFADDFTITLQSSLTVDDDTNITVDASGREVVINRDDAGDSFKLFDLSAGNALTLTNVTLEFGLPAIYSRGALTVLSSTLRANTQGAIQHKSADPLLISHSYFHDNGGYSSVNGGGALSLSGSGAVTVSHSLFKNNYAYYQGGAIYNNKSGGLLTVLNSTFSGNRAYSIGGAIDLNNGTAEIIHSTFSDNYARWYGADVYHDSGDSLLLANSILADSSSDKENCRTNPGSPLTEINSLIESGNCGGTLTGDPALQSLGDYGGATQTFALPSDSPAVDAADPAYCPDDDQRDQPRPYGAACDLGAFEAQGYTLVASGSNQSTLLNSAFTEPLSVTLYHGGTDIPVASTIPITITGPASGAGLSTVSSNGWLDSSGHYEQSVQANGIAGTYTVSATLTGVSQPALFTLTNLAADLGITKTMNTATPAPGQAINYTLAFSNTGSTTAAGVIIADTLPSELDQVSSVLYALDAGVVVTPTAGNPYTWAVSDLSPGRGGVITLTGILTDSITLAQSIVNQVEIGSDTPEENSDNNQASVSGSSACYPVSRLYVDADATTGAATGLSWADAYTTLQDGLAAVQLCGFATEIWVAEGVYYPDEGYGQSDNDRNATFTLINGVSIYGGFSGVETLLSQRSATANPTILSGDLQQDDVSASGVVTDALNTSGTNAYHVLVADNVDSSAVLDGFTLTAGRASGSTSYDKRGSGLYTASGSPTLRNLVVSGNYAAGLGGGLYARYANLDLFNVTFNGNRSSGGSAAYLYGGQTNMEQAQFKGNQTTQVIQMYNGHVSTITNGLFSGNSSEAIYNNSSSLTLLNVSFGGNYASSNSIINSFRPQSNVLTNVIMWNNGSDTGATPFNQPDSFNISHSVIQGGCPFGATCTNVFGDDPLFVDAPTPSSTPSQDGDLRLLPGSAAINAGTNSGAPADDLQGLARPIDGTVDAGAYESQGFTLTYGSGSGQYAIVGNTFADPLTLTITSNAGEPVGPGGQVTFTGPSAGASVFDTPLTAQTDAGGAAQLSVTANSIIGSYVVTATANGVDGQATFALTNTQAALLLSKQVSPTSAAPGDTITYTLIFTNDGAAPITNVSFTDTIPASITVQQVISSGDVAIAHTFSSQSAEVFEPATLQPGDSGIITLTAQLDSPLAAGALQNTATITSPNISGGATELVAVEVTVLNISSVITGATLTAAENEADDTIIGAVTASDINGEALSFAITNRTPDGDALTVDATTGDILINNSSALDYEAATQHILTVAVRDGELTATTTVTVNLTNTDTDLTLSKAVWSDLAAESFASVDYLATPGGLITYTLTFTNVGQDDATGVVITDALPNEFTIYDLQFTINNDGTITQTGTNPHQWSVSDLAVGEGGVITLTGQVDSGLGITVFTNTAGITTPIQDSSPANNVAEVGIGGCAFDIEVQNNSAAGDGSLRQAIADLCEGGTITFAADMTITLTITDETIYIYKGLSIDAGNRNVTLTADLDTFDALDISPIIEVAVPTAPVTLTHLTMTGAPGSALLAWDTELNVISSTIAYNTRDAESGFVMMNGGFLRLVGSTIISNTGMGVEVTDGTAEIMNSVIAYNIGGYGGVGLMMDNSPVTVTHSALVGNGDMDDWFGNANISVWSNTGAVWLEHSIVAGGLNNGIFGDQDCDYVDATPTSIVDAGYNLLGSNCPITETTSSRVDSTRAFTDIVTALGYYDSDILTFALPPNSPALDGGASGSCLIATDQRGLSRPYGDACDIGPFESRGYSLTGSGSDQATLINTQFAAPLQVTLISGDSGVPVSGQVITFTAPATGAGLTTTTITATTDADGAVSVTVYAHGSAGSYDVTASIGDSLPPVVFNLTNTLSDADLQISKSVTPDTAAPGEAITYTLTFANIGGNTAEGVVITDVVGSHLSSVTADWSGDDGLTMTRTPGLTYEWTVSDLAFGQGGVITLSGILNEPLAGGIYSNTAVITTTSPEGDAANNSAAIGLTVPNIAPEMAQIDEIVITGTDTITLTFTATDANSDDLSFSLLDSTAGMTVSNAGLFTWQPPEVGYDELYTATVAVSDGLTATEQIIFITVLDVNQAPQLGPVADMSVVEGATLAFTVAFSDTDTPAQPLTLSMSDAPVSATLDSSGNFSWPTTESDDGVYTLTLHVTDGSLTDSTTIAITVTEENQSPTLTAIPDQSVAEGSTITFTATATDTDIPAQPLTFSLGNAPAGAALDGSGNFSWPTTESDDGVHTVTVNVSDGVVTASQTITLTVTEVNQPPVLAALNDVTVDEGAVISFTATATDTDVPAQTLTFSLVDGPFGATIGSSSGFFSWQTDDTDGGGVYTLTVVVSDGVLTDNQTILITVDEVNVAPTFATTLTGRTVAEGDTLSVNAIASDPDVPAQPLTYSLANAPAGMSINGIGRITWTTTEADGPSSWNVSVRVSDGVVTASQTLAITVTDINSPVTLGPLSDVTVAEGQTVSFTVVATDTDTPAQTLSYSVSSDTAATIDSSGNFSWLTTEADGGDVYPVTVLVSDGVVTSSQSIAITVTEVNNAPLMAPLADRTVSENSLVGFTVIATDTDSPAQELTFSLSNAPAEAAIGSNSGDFAWLTTEADGPGVYSATVLVSDGLLTTSQTIAITVTEQNDAPVITSVAAQSITETLEISFTIAASDDPAQNLFFSLDNAPAAAIINDDGNFSWLTTEDDGPGEYALTVLVSDGLLTSTQVLTITVLEDNTAPTLAPIADQSVVEGDLLTVTLVATDTDVPTQTLTYTVSGLPAAATVDGSGIFRWQTGEADGFGVYTATFIVSDGTLTDSQTAVITVTETNSPPHLTGSTSLTATEGVTFTYTFTATDDNDPPDLTFGIFSAPAGATLDSASGLFRWQPTETQGPGAYLFSLTVTDTTGLTDTAVIILNVQEANSAPTLAPIPDQTIGATHLLTFTAIATDTDWPANTLTYSLVDALTGAVIDPASGVFSWTPGSAGVYTLTVQVTDDGTPPLTGATPVTITVAGPRLAITKTVAPAIPTPGEAITYTIVVANSGEGDAVGVRVRDVLPAGISGVELDQSISISINQAITLTLNATVDSDVGYGVTITNTATYTYLSDSGQADAALTTLADITAPTFITSPVLITPTNGISITNGRPVFDWEDAIDDLSGVVSYTLLISSSNNSVSVQEAATTITTTQSGFTPTVDLANGVYTWTVRAHDAVGNAGDYVLPAATFVISKPVGGIYLPIIFAGASSGSNPGSNRPDLVVDNLVATSSQVTMTIRNAGNSAVVDAFWVDVYFNPNQMPAFNQPWNTIAPAGAVWGVTQSLAQDETLVLTTGGDYYLGPPDSSPNFPAGAQVYAYVDSVNHNTTYGNVQESNEGNNLSEPVVSSAGLAGTVISSGKPVLVERLPER